MSKDDTNISEIDFNAPGYISNFLKNIKAGDELRQLQTLRKTLNLRYNSAAETIKDIVFEHYKHFIETSKEILNLEREIYRLSTFLSEQKSLIENMMEMNGQEKKSMSSGSVYSVSTVSHNQLHSLMHKMDGVASILNTLKDTERILLQSQLTLLNSDTMEPKHPVLMVLFANSLLIGHPSNTPGSKYPFYLVANHALETLAVINVKSHLTTDNSSKIEFVLQFLIFPEQMYLKCESARQKREWLDTIEQTKIKHEQEKSLIRQATIRAKRRSGSVAPSPQKQGGLKHNSELTQNASSGGENEKSKLSNADTQWLNDLIDELHVIISDRHMEQAVEMLLEWKSCNCKDTVINTKFQTLEHQVIKILSDEVRRPGSLHGGTQSLNRPLTLLTALGRGVYAVDIYLKRRGAFLRMSTSELVSEEPLSYVRQISTLFINEIIDIANEFNDQRQYYCLVLQWSSSELSILLSMIRRHVIETASTMTVLANTWRILINNCDLLNPIGMDFLFEINRLLIPSFTKAMQTNFSNVIDSICLRITEEKWKPYNLENESNLNRFLEEMSDFGLSIDWAAYNATSNFDTIVSSEYSRFSVQISQSACQFARVAYSISRDLSLLVSVYLERLSDSFVQMLWCEYMLHLATATSSDVQRSTAKFIVGQVIPLCDETYQTTAAPNGRFVFQLLTDKFPSLLKFAKSQSFDEEIANV